MLFSLVVRPRSNPSLFGTIHHPSFITKYKRTFNFISLLYLVYIIKDITKKYKHSFIERTLDQTPFLV